MAWGRLVVARHRVVFRKYVMSNCVGSTGVVAVSVQKIAHSYVILGLGFFLSCRLVESFNLVFFTLHDDSLICLELGNFADSLLLEFDVCHLVLIVFDTFERDRDKC